MRFDCISHFTNEYHIIRLCFNALIHIHTYIHASRTPAICKCTCIRTCVVYVRTYVRTCTHTYILYIHASQIPAVCVLTILLFSLEVVYETSASPYSNMGLPKRKSRMRLWTAEGKCVCVCVCVCVCICGWVVRVYVCVHVCACMYSYTYMYANTHK